MIDWSNLPVLIGPRWRGRDPFARERLGRIKQAKRGGRHQGKKHATADERVAAALRRSLLAKANVLRAEVAAAYHAAVRAYWAGERDDHP